VFEDAASGIEAALAANMWSVGLGPADRVGKAHIVLPNLAGLTWNDLLVRLSEVNRALEVQR
jgi:kojibiose phosphorylase